MSQFRIPLETKDDEKLGYSANKPDSIYAIYANFLDYTSSKKVVDDYTLYPFCCFGVINITAVNSSISVPLIGVLISPTHVLTMAHDLVQNLPADITQVTITFASFFNLANESKVSQIFYNKEYHICCNYAILLIEKSLGTESGYLGIIAQNAQIEYKFIIAGLLLQNEQQQQQQNEEIINDKNQINHQLVYTVQDLVDQNEESVFFQKIQDCPYYTSIAINYDVDFGYSVIALICAESHLQLIGQKFNDEKLYNIKRWMLNDANSCYSHKDYTNKLHLSYLENCNDIQVANLIDYNQAKTHKGQVIATHRLNFDTLASVGQDKIIKIWNMKLGEQLQELLITSNNNNSQQLIMDEINNFSNLITSVNTLLVYIQDQNILLYDFKLQKEIKTISFPQNLTAISLINEFIVAGDETGSIFFLNIQTYEIQQQIESAIQNDLIQKKQSQLQTFSFSQNKNFEQKGHSSQITALSHILCNFNNNMDQESMATLAVGDAKGCLKLWNIQQKTLIFDFKGHSDEKQILKISQIQQLMVSCSADQTVKFWDLKSGAEVKTIALKNPIPQLAVLNQQEICVSDGNMICIINIKSLQSMYFQKHKSSITSVSVINQKLFTTSDQDGIIKLWRVQGFSQSNSQNSKISSSVLSSIPKLKRQQTVDENELFEECLNLKSVVEKQRQEIDDLTNENEKLKAEQLFHFVENNIDSKVSLSNNNNNLNQYKEQILELENKIAELNTIIMQSDEEKQLFLKKCEEFYQEKEDKLNILQNLREQEIASFQKIKQKELLDIQQQNQIQINNYKQQIKERDSLIEEIKTTYIQEQEKINQIIIQKDQAYQTLQLQNRQIQEQLELISREQKDKNNFQQQFVSLEKENNELQQIILQQKEKLEYFSLLHNNLKNENHQMHQQLEHLQSLTGRLPNQNTNGCIIPQNQNEYQYLLNELAKVNKQKAYLQIENDNLKQQLSSAVAIVNNQQPYQQNTQIISDFNSIQIQDFQSTPTVQQQLLTIHDQIKTPQRKNLVVQETSSHSRTGSTQTQKVNNQQQQTSLFNRVTRIENGNNINLNNNNSINSNNLNIDNQQVQFTKIDQQLKQRQSYQSMTPEKYTKQNDNKSNNLAFLQNGYFSSRKDEYNSKYVQQQQPQQNFYNGAYQ